MTWCPFRCDSPGQHTEKYSFRWYLTLKERRTHFLVLKIEFHQRHPLDTTSPVNSDGDSNPPLRTSSISSTSSSSNISIVLVLVILGFPRMVTYFTALSRIYRATVTHLPTPCPYAESVSLSSEESSIQVCRGQTVLCPLWTVLSSSDEVSGLPASSPRLLRLSVFALETLELFDWTVLRVLISFPVVLTGGHQLQQVRCQ